MNTFAQEFKAGQRFEFGKNWASFLAHLDGERTQVAVESLKTMLDCDSLKGESFLDAGSGSELFSLAARQLGATVTSFDYDPNSVARTSTLKQRFFPDDANWKVLSGSVLDH